MTPFLFDLGPISWWWNIYYRCNMLWITCCWIQNGRHIFTFWKGGEILMGLQRWDTSFVMINFRFNAKHQNRGKILIHCHVGVWWLLVGNEHCLYHHVKSQCKFQVDEGPPIVWNGWRDSNTIENGFHAMVGC